MQVSLRPFAVRSFQRVTAAHSIDLLNNKLLLGTTTNSILQVDMQLIEVSDHNVKHRCVSVVHQGHCGESRRDPNGVTLPSLAISAVCCFPSPNERLYATVGQDCVLRIWHSQLRSTLVLPGRKDAVVDMGMRVSFGFNFFLYEKVAEKGRRCQRRRYVNEVYCDFFFVNTLQRRRRCH